MERQEEMEQKVEAVDSKIRDNQSNCLITNWAIKKNISTSAQGGR